MPQRYLRQFAGIAARQLHPKKQSTSWDTEYPLRKMFL